MAVQAEDPVGVERHPVQDLCLAGRPRRPGPRQVLGVVAVVAGDVEHTGGVEAQGEREADLERAGGPVRGVGGVLRLDRVQDEVAVVELVGEAVPPRGSVGERDAGEELRAGDEVLAREQGIGGRGGGGEGGPDHGAVGVVEHEAAVVAHGGGGGRPGWHREGPVLPVGGARPDQAAVVGEPERSARGRRVVAVGRPRDGDVGGGGEPDAHGEAPVRAVEAEREAARRGRPGGARGRLQRGPRGDFGGQLLRLRGGTWHGKKRGEREGQQQADGSHGARRRPS
ncbi:hypothetical protein BDA96_03G471400 [Sorghum bicolor]|uniref:Uncharacterized protein n=1 Tax=Sorghum bicolor TaxID=4558 RepID=A0A921RIZ8_SORBI|nr:hypothetical protein BDA96_03G471400 [Sorghum bicolor]